MNRSRKAKLKAIPRPPSTADAETRKFHAALVESLETLSGQRGNDLDRAVTRRELAGSGGDLFRMVNGQLVPAGELVEPPRTTTPEPQKLPAPTGLVASGAFENVVLHWEYQDVLVEYVAYYEIYRSASDDIATATLALRPGFKVASDAVGEGKTFFYWVRAVSGRGIASDFNAVNGEPATTAISAGTIITAIEGRIVASSLHASLTAQLGTYATTTGVNQSIETLQSQSEALAKSINIVGANLGTLIEPDANGDYPQSFSSVKETAEATATALESAASLVNTITANLGPLIATDGDGNLPANAATIQETLTATANSAGDANTLAGEAQSAANSAASIAGNAQSTANDAAELAGIAKVRWEVKSTVRGLVGGVGFYNDGTDVGFGISATQFWLYDPTTETGSFPFIVDDGVVYMKDAVIKNASIDLAKLKALTADDITGVNGYFKNLTASFLTIETGIIGSSIQSENYSTTAGWKLEKTGQWHLNNGTIEIRDDANRLRVKIGKL